MKQRRIVLLLAMLIGIRAGAIASDPFKNNLPAYAGNEAVLDELAGDIGAGTAAGSFHQGKALGFPVGFDVGVHGAEVGVSDDDAVLKDDGSSIQSAFGQLEVGLPARINIIGRGGNLEDAKFYGGGLRVGIFKSMVPVIPSISLTGLYNKVSHDYFDADVYSANAVLSFDVPFIHPYIGAGWDQTELELTDQAMAAAAPGTVKKDGSASGYRVEAGINLSLIPFTYLTLGGGLANGEKLFHLALGAKI